MIQKIIISALAFSFLLAGCNFDTYDCKDDLINQVIRSSKDLNTDKKITILTTKFCTKNNCQIFFQDYLDHFQFRSMEEAFMRGEGSGIIIESIDEENGRIIMTKRTERERIKNSENNIYTRKLNEKQIILNCM